tara:strand:- start:5394 stop:6389 length:996 start_codon:yes stop_codon:yes gene_type:complete
MQKKYCVGIIGLGVGLKHYEAFEKIKNIRVTALCDFDKKEIKKIKKKKTQKIYKSAKELIESNDVDIVSIASYDSFHFEQIIHCIKFKKHIFVEKPICLTLSELKKIKKLLDKNPEIYFGSNMNLRTSKSFIDLKKRIKNDDVYFIEADYNSGRIHKIINGWRTFENYHSIILSSAIHVIDLICWLVGSFPESVYALSNKIVTRNTKFKYDDFSVALLKFKNGLICKVSANIGCIYPHFHKISLYTKTFTYENTIDGPYFIYKDGNKLKKVNQKYNYKNRQRDLIISEYISRILNKDKKNNKKFIFNIFKLMEVCFSIINSTKTKKRILLS